MNKTKLSAEGVSAYIELPIGKTVIGNIEYTVEEVVENAGLENEYKHNVIKSMVPVGSTEETVTETTTEEVAMADEEVVSEEVIKEEMAEGDVVSGATEETVAEETTTEVSSLDEEEIMKIIQPKLDEIYEMIAELKAAMEVKVETVKEETMSAKVPMSNKFAQLSALANKNKK